MSTPPADNGVVNVPSRHSVSDTLDRLENILKTKGIKVFIRIDQQAEAQQVDLTLRPTQVLLFGNPAAGTPMMQASPSSAVDLPLKVVAWQDDAGQVWISYNSPEYLQQRHHIPDTLIQNIAGIRALVDAARA